MQFVSEVGNAALFTALAYYTIGSILMGVAIHMWWVHPINRSFIFGSFLTPEGTRLVLGNWHLVCLFGLFTFSCAVEHNLHWYYSHGHPEYSNLLLFMGWFEAAISLFTAAVVARIVIRWATGAGDAKRGS